MPSPFSFPPLRAVVLLCLLGASLSAAQRVPWTTSRVTGAPTPPAPYSVVRAFPNLAFTNPVELASAPGSDRLFVVELRGKIFSFPNRPDASVPELVADLATMTGGFERAFCIVFHPGFETNRFAYVCYAQKAGLPEGTRVSRFTVTRDGVPRLEPGSEKILITWRSGGHNGGSLHFGPDGCLYISAGDSEVPSPPDPLDTGQDLSDLMSSVLRIDVDREEPGRAYRVPTDNPFVNTPGARPEIWAYGLRNPWKMSFDSATGELWAGDVGWEMWELVYRIERGGNYGWSLFEGSRQSVKPDGPRGPTPVTPPIMEHSHTEARSITGGYVYRGAKLPGLRGAYVYGDFVTGKIWALRHERGRAARSQEIADAPFQIICFGQDRAGELFIVDYAGGIYRLEPKPARAQERPFPVKLSETGLFTDGRALKPAPGVLPYRTADEPWMDHATAERVFAVPGDGRLGIQQRQDLQIGWIKGAWTFPADTVLAKTISIETERGNPASRRRLETQLLHFDGDTWQPYNFLWNDAQTDAVLAGPEPSQIELTIRDTTAPGGVRRQQWRFAGRTECMLCHNSRPAFLLGFHPAQLDHDGPGGNPLRELDRLGCFELSPFATLVANAKPKAAPAQGLAKRIAGDDLDARARNYLHINCAHCHQQGAGTTAQFDARAGLTPDKAKLIGEPALQGGFGLDDAKLVAPGAPESSALLYRMAKLGHGRMPQLGSTEVDDAGLHLIAEWIRSLDASASSSSSRVPSVPSATEHRLATTSGALALLLELTAPGSRATHEQRLAVARQAAEKSAFVRDLFERFLPPEERVPRLGRDFAPAAVLSLAGDAARGRKVFFAEGGAQCATCHRIGNEGRELGPELSHIAQRLDRAQLLESLTAPSKLVAPEYAAQVVETTGGEEFTALVRERGKGFTVYRDLTGRDVRLRDSEIRAAKPQQLSLMPEGLLASLTAQQAADLLAFLESLR